MSKAQFDIAKAYINAKDYDKARSILTTIDHAAARDWEAKIDKLSPPPPRKADKSNRVAWLFLAILLLAVVTGIAIYSLNQNTSWAAAEFDAWLASP